jgi:hypothetical protein
MGRDMRTSSINRTWFMGASIGNILNWVHGEETSWVLMGRGRLLGRCFLGIK